MRNTDKSFRAELNERLKQYSEEPEPWLWEEIVAATKSPRPKSIPWKRAGLASLAVLALLSGWIVYDYHRAVTSQTLVAGGKSIQKEENAIENFRSRQDEVNITGKPSSNDALISRAPSHTDAKIKAGIQSISVNKFNANTVILASKETYNNVEASSEREHVIDNKIPTFVIVEVPQPNQIDQAVNNEKAETPTSNKKKKSRRYNLYFTAMPTFGYQRVKTNAQDKFIIESIDKIRAFSSERLGLRAELGVELPVKNRINFFAGVLYFQRKQTIGYTEKEVAGTNVTVDPDGNIVVVTEYDLVHKSFEHELKNVGAQVGLNFILSKRTFLQTAGTGIEFHVALNKLVEDAPAVTNNPTAYVFYNLYYRLQYPSEGRLKAVVQPTLNYSFYIDENFNAPFYVKPYGLGLNVGATYNF